MKRAAAVLTAILIAVLLSGCFVVLVPSEDRGSDEPKEFSKDGLTITLTERFTERESEVGFDAYYVSREAGVMVIKEEFTLEEGLEDLPLETYIRNVIRNNGHDCEPISKDGLLYYTNEKTLRGEPVQYYSFVYKGEDAFWIVQFSCFTADLEKMEPKIIEWAKSVTV